MYFSDMSEELDVKRKHSSIVRQSCDISNLQVLTEMEVIVMLLLESTALNSRQISSVLRSVSAYILNTTYVHLCIVSLYQILGVD